MRTCERAWAVRAAVITSTLIRSSAWTCLLSVRSLAKYASGIYLGLHLYCKHTQRHTGIQTVNTLTHACVFLDQIWYYLLISWNNAKNIYKNFGFDKLKMVYDKVSKLLLNVCVCVRLWFYIYLAGLHLTCNRFSDSTSAEEVKVFLKYLHKQNNKLLCRSKSKKVQVLKWM